MTLTTAERRLKLRTQPALRFLLWPHDGRLESGREPISQNALDEQPHNQDVHVAAEDLHTETVTYNSTDHRDVGPKFPFCRVSD